MIVDISFGEIVVKNEFHVADDGQFFDKFLVELWLNVKLVAVGEDDDGRIEFLYLDVNEFFHDEFDEFRLVKFDVFQLVLRG